MSDVEFATKCQRLWPRSPRSLLRLSDASARQLSVLQESTPKTHDGRGHWWRRVPGKASTAGRYFVTALPLAAPNSELPVPLCQQLLRNSQSHGFYHNMTKKRRSCLGIERWNAVGCVGHHLNQLAQPESSAAGSDVPMDPSGSVEEEDASPAIGSETSARGARQQAEDEIGQFPFLLGDSLVPSVRVYCRLSSTFARVSRCDHFFLP